MKTIENKKVEIAGQQTPYFELISNCIKVPPKEGFTYDLFEKISRVEAAIKGGVGESILLEDADFEFVKSKVIAMPWAIYDIELKNFMDYIKNIK